MVKRIGKIECDVCGKDINLKKDKYVLIGTYNNSKPDKECFYHWECFKQWFQERVSERSKKQMEFMQKKAIEVLNNPMIKGMMSNVAQRVSNAYSGEDHPETITLVSKKLKENGRKKTNIKRARKLQAQMQ